MIAWVDVSDLFAAPLKRERLFRARHFQAFDEAWDLRVVRIEVAQLAPPLLPRRRRVRDGFRVERSKG